MRTTIRLILSLMWGVGSAVASGYYFPFKWWGLDILVAGLTGLGTAFALYSSREMRVNIRPSAELALRGLPYLNKAWVNTKAYFKQFWPPKLWQGIVLLSCINCIYNILYTRNWFLEKVQAYHLNSLPLAIYWALLFGFYLMLTFFCICFLLVAGETGNVEEDEIRKTSRFCLIILFLTTPPGYLLLAAILTLVAIGYSLYKTALFAQRLFIKVLNFFKFMAKVVWDVMKFCWKTTRNLWFFIHSENLVMCSVYAFVFGSASYYNFVIRLHYEFVPACLGGCGVGLVVALIHLGTKRFILASRATAIVIP